MDHESPFFLFKRIYSATEADEIRRNSNIINSVIQIISGEICRNVGDSAGLDFNKGKVMETKNTCKPSACSIDLHPLLKVCRQPLLLPPTTPEEQIPAKVQPFLAKLL
jgi:hypothetical protein